MLTPALTTPELYGFDKPNGIHSVRGMDELAAKALPELAGLPEYGLLHRLDFGTSGLLLFARTLPAYEKWRRWFKAHALKKIYVAESIPAVGFQRSLLPKELPHRFEIPFVRSGKSSKRMLAVVDVLHQDWLQNTRYCLLRARLERTPSLARGPLLETRSELLELTWTGAPETMESDGATSSPRAQMRWCITTGVMHQIRLTSALLGLPLVGDLSYGGAPSNLVGASTPGVRPIAAPEAIGLRAIQIQSPEGEVLSLE